jgi:energy-coupling factor transporter ATP-binding protein EcfA2
VTAGPAIEARGWGWRHAGREAWAVRGLDLRVDAGERVLLAGASGSGKSTLLAAIAGLLDGSGGEAEGELLVRGRPPREARDETGLLFQDPASQLVMARAGDEIAFPLENRCVPREDIWPRVERALGESALGIARDHPTEALSGGEQQRLALAAVLAAEPALVLLDEPTANLDAAAAAAFRLRIAALAGRTLVLVEHRADDLAGLIDRVVAIDGARGVIADGPPDTVFARDRGVLDAAGIWVPGTRPTARRGRPGPAVVEARSLSYRHPGSARDAVSVAGLELRGGEALALTGPNGAGKTTLALLLGGLLRPRAGDALVAPGLAHRGERSLWRMPARALVGRVGSVFQDPAQQFVRGRVDREIEAGPLQAGAAPHDARARAAELMDRLALAHLAAANPFTLSGGEQRRLSVATSLAASPRALVLDEPTFGQDRRGHAELLRLLDAYRGEGGAVCVATHDELLVDGLADRELRLAA